MPIDVSTALVIRRPVDEVSSFAGDPSNAPRWYANIASVDWQTPPPLRIGSRLSFVARFLGLRLAYTYEVVELVPGERLVMRTSEGPFPMETTYTWATEGLATTRMTLRNRGEPRGFFRLTSPFLALAVRQANRKDLARLKSLLEAAPRRDAGSTG